MTILDQNGHWSKSGRLTSGFGVVLDPNMTPSGPNPKRDIKQKGSFWDLFWVILGHIWVIFGPLQGPNPKRDIKQIDPFWVIFGSYLAPIPGGVKYDPNRPNPKRDIKQMGGLGLRTTP